MRMWRPKSWLSSELGPALVSYFTCMSLNIFWFVDRTTAWIKQSADDVIKV